MSWSDLPRRMSRISLNVCDINAAAGRPVQAGGLDCSNLSRSFLGTVESPFRLLALIQEVCVRAFCREMPQTAAGRLPVPHWNKPRKAILDSEVVALNEWISLLLLATPQSSAVIQKLTFP